MVLLAIGAPAGRTRSLPPAPAASSGGIWLLTFDDEFDGPGVDAAKWSNGFGWGESADHVAAYCDPAGNTVESGVLVQRADNRPLGGKPYRGACLNTKNKFSQLYGYWEARMKVPAGAGLWSAFWAKPNDESWPPELDVEEISGHATDRVIMTVHWREGTAHRADNRKFSGPDFAADYHVFGAEWAPEGTTWYVDGVERGRTPEGAAHMSEGGAFYLLLDLQAGLAGAEPPDASTPWPAIRAVDYVRVWSRPALPAPPVLPALPVPPVPPL
jgi:beta-glucanase (GH16 family)